jgi:regulatory protein
MAEMRTRLVAKELPPEVVEREIEELHRVGLLDDLALAADLVDRYSGRERMGKLAVVAKLRARGIPEEAIEHAVSMIDVDSETTAVEDVARERLRKMGSVPRGVAYRRLYAFLQRKGFGNSDIAAVLERLLA